MGEQPAGPELGEVSGAIQTVATLSVLAFAVWAIWRTFRDTRDGWDRLGIEPMSDEDRRHNAELARRRAERQQEESDAG